MFVYVTVIPAILIIAFCHTTVYLVSRWHINRIKTEQLPSEAKTKFLQERKALKTTSIIIAFVFLSYVPSLLYGILKRDIWQTNLLPIVLSCIFLNSLLNPVIHVLEKQRSASKYDGTAQNETRWKLTLKTSLYVQEDFQIHYLPFGRFNVPFYFIHIYEMLFMFICKFTITYVNNITSSQHMRLST